jgi:Predicted Zn-dependent hydrolases of the beta-lactamase fold
MNPEEAVRAFLELRAKTLIPMHYGTFPLGFEPLHEPPQRLLAAARAHGIAEKGARDDRGQAGGAVKILIATDEHG